MSKNDTLLNIPAPPPAADLSDRPDLREIVNLVPEGTKVIDLGAGDGTLLAYLAKHKKIEGRGIELSSEGVKECVARGLFVYQSNLDEGLADYEDKTFDYVICSQTIQQVHKPRYLLEEILRVGRNAIISIPNFGYYKIRFQLLIKGRMPKSSTLPFEWYDTPNIHLMTTKDFRSFLQGLDIKILKEVHSISHSGYLHPFSDWWPNLFAPTVIYLITK